MGLILPRLSDGEFIDVLLNLLNVLLGSTLLLMGSLIRRTTPWSWYGRYLRFDRREPAFMTIGLAYTVLRRQWFHAQLIRPTWGHDFTRCTRDEEFTEARCFTRIEWPTHIFF